MKVTEIIRNVALHLGVDPDEMPTSAESPYPSLADRIRANLEESVAQAILSTRKELLTGWRLLPDDGLTVADDGSVLLPLPDDFLVLHSIRMSDWEREVTEAYPSDHWLHRLQGSRWHGLRGTPARPVAFETLTEDGKRALRLYSSGRGATLASGWYLPAPKINDADEIDIPFQNAQCIIQNSHEPCGIDCGEHTV